MLLKITNQCTMGCCHCFDCALANGSMMDHPTFMRSVQVIEELKPSVLMVSGGEPTEHPDFINYMKILKPLFKGGRALVVASNGMFLENEELTKQIYDLGVLVQITNDKRFYPRVPVPYTGRSFEEEIKLHNNFVLIDEIKEILPIGRASNFCVDHKFGPKCFNMIQMTAAKSIDDALYTQERAMGKYCNPSILHNGDIVFGESSMCKAFANVMNENWRMESKMNAMLYLAGLIQTGQPACNKCAAWDATHKSGVTYTQLLSGLYSNEKKGV